MIRKLPIWIRTVAVTLLIAMVYYFAGYRMVYSLIIHAAKNDASFAIHHNASFSNITVTASAYAAIKWTDKDKEFLLKGQLYDVVDVQKSGETYILKVYQDKNETRWAKAMHDVAKFLFPAPHSKKNNCAEGLLSAFQKEYSPIQTVKVGYVPEVKEVCFWDEGNAPSLIIIKPIWHPPATC